MCILLLSFSVHLRLCAFQQLMRFAFLFVYIIRNSRSFLISCLHGNINMNFAVVVVVWLRAGVSGFR